MTYPSNVTLKEGIENLRELCQAYQGKTVDWNEAETRFHFIDVLIHCLGWPRDQIHVERHFGGEYADYILVE